MHVYNPCSCQIFKMNGGDKMRYFMGIDNGGTFSKAALFDENGNQIAVASIFVPVITPSPDIQKEIWKHFGRLMCRLSER